MQALTHTSVLMLSLQRPYTAESTTYYMPPEVEAEARRSAQREAAEVNRRAATLKALAARAEHAAEQEAMRSTLQAEVGRAGEVAELAVMRCECVGLL